MARQVVGRDVRFNIDGIELLPMRERSGCGSGSCSRHEPTSRWADGVSLNLSESGEDRWLGTHRAH